MKNFRVNVDEIDTCKSISQTLYKELLCQYFLPKNYKAKLQALKSCGKHFCTKKLLVKCWWNWCLEVERYVVLEKNALIFFGETWEKILRGSEVGQSESHHTQLTDIRQKNLSFKIYKFFIQDLLSAILFVHTGSGSQPFWARDTLIHSKTLAARLCLNKTKILVFNGHYW